MTSEKYWTNFGEIETCTGAMFSINDPQFDIEAIAHGAARKCRFNGQCKYLYPVSAHQIMVSRIMQHRGGNPLEGLLHDGNESYLPDVPSPYKPELPDMRALEDRIDLALRKHFELPLHKTPECQYADMVALMIEAYHLLPSRGLSAAWERCAEFRAPAGVYMRMGYRIPAYDIEPAKAKAMYLARYQELISQ